MVETLLCDDSALILPVLGGEGEGSGKKNVQEEQAMLMPPKRSGRTHRYHRGMRPELKFALSMMLALAVLTTLTLSALPGRSDAAAVCRMVIGGPLSGTCRDQ